MNEIKTKKRKGMNDQGINDAMDAVQESKVAPYRPRQLNQTLLVETHRLANHYCSVRVHGDIKGCHRWKRGGMSFKIIHDGASFDCKAWERDGMEADTMMKYENKNCIVHGNIVADYFGTHRFALHVDNITVMDKVTKLKTLKQECEAEKMFTDKKSIMWSKVKSIGIISKPKTQGYVDFCTQFKIPCSIENITITLEGPDTAQQCGEAIVQLSTKVDVIVIIRGGGDTVDISNSYDKMELFRCIKQSPIPIITAIGHQQDSHDALLITQVSDVDFATPSTAANQMTTLMLQPWNDVFTALYKDLTYAIDSTIDVNVNAIIQSINTQIDQAIHQTLGGPLVQVNKRHNTIVVFDGTHYRKVALDQCPILESQQTLYGLKALKNAITGLSVRIDVATTIDTINDISDVDSSIKAPMVRGLVKIQGLQKCSLEENVDAGTQADEIHDIKALKKVVTKYKLSRRSDNLKAMVELQRMIKCHLNNIVARNLQSMVHLFQK